MYKNTTRNIILPIFFAVAVVAGIFIGSFYKRGATVGGGMIGNLPVRNESKITTLLSLIDNNYLERVDLDSITEVIMPMITAQLDPHSVYIPASRYAAVNESLDGMFFGIGVKFNMLTDTAVVLNVIPGGPSDMAGIENGDRIINIDGRLIAGNRFAQDSVVTLLRGKYGSVVKLDIERQGSDELLPIAVTRGEIPLNSILASFEVVPGIGYVKMVQFSKNTDAELHAILDGFKRSGVDKLILDLRGNSGGFYEQAVTIANDFLDGGKLIVYTEDKNGRRKESFSNGKGLYRDMQLEILINEESASSSEILAGAIQDNDRGLIIGRRSFGKGLVQNQIPFRDGSAVRLTVARYYTPTGRSIQRPYTNNTADYYNDTAERYEHNEFFTADSIRFADSLRFTTPGGRVVYGGGGIMPDVFVPLDTTDMTGYYIKSMASNALYIYTMRYGDAHRRELNAVKTVGELRALLDAAADLYDNFVKFAASHGLRGSAEEVERSRRLLTAQLRGFIGRNTSLDENGYYSNIYPVDDVIMTAIRRFEHGE